MRTLLFWMLTGISCIYVTSDLAAAEPEIWPQWRGPTRDGKVAGDRWPSSLQGDALQQVWRVELGPGYSGPIVSKDRVFVTETVDKTREVVRALDRQTGAEIWRAEWPGALSVPFFAKANGDWIRATPAYDGESLFVGGIRDVLVCLNAETGAERWRVDFAEKFEAPLPAFGMVCSPLVAGDFVYVQAGAGLVKLEKRTGNVVWRVLEDGGGMNGSAFSSPVLGEIQGKEQLIVQTREKLVGLDPDKGGILWSQTVPAFRGMNILTPTVYDGSIFTSTYGGQTFRYQPEKEGMQVKTLWSTKAQGYMSSPVVINGFAYLHLRNQRFTCINLKDGTEQWRTKPYGKYWSLVAQGNRILALDEEGILFLIRANPGEFEMLDSRQLTDNPTWGHLAVCDDFLFVRELNAITIYRWKMK